ncbi:Pyridine nucleotide-disufhide oxidoreductase [Aphelenchoides besseyi]|nr:Pyridine nucleotide-disufhide oxidoreductase [Aphelenchoides besseyi]
MLHFILEFTATFSHKKMVFYAVRKGRQTGIFSTWTECSDQVRGFRDAQYKKFQTQQEALQFMNGEPSSNMPKSSISHSTTPINRKRKYSETTKEKLVSNDLNVTTSAITVYTDGACSFNGRAGAKAGFGVFWGDNHEDNFSAPLVSVEQTNNRAEYQAIIHALETAIRRDIKTLRICTDSNLLIRSMTSDAKATSSNRNPVLVVGGGIAGVSVVNELLDFDGEQDVDLIFVCGRSGFLKTIRNYEKLGTLMEKFDVEMQTADEAFGSRKVNVFYEDVSSWDCYKKQVTLTNGELLTYSSLCIATGARPKSIADRNERVLQIRDTDTIDKLQNRLTNCRRAVILGDGGIAMEAAYELKNLDIIWASKNAHIGSPFFDATIAIALEARFSAGRKTNHVKQERPFDKFTVGQNIGAEKSNLGCSLGPNWLSQLKQPTSMEQERMLTIKRCVAAVGYHSVNPKDKSDCEWGVYVEFNDGTVVGCDLIIEALGVVPLSDIWKRDWPQLKIAFDSGIQVDECMQTNAPDVFACGDVCTIIRKNVPRTWKQMRLWSQARVQGIYTARCMMDPDYEADPWFDMFTHVTTFGGDYLAETDDVEHVFTDDQMTRISIQENRVVGAILVGPTDLDEVFETLILNAFDISTLPRPIVNHQIDISDYFD